MAASSVPAQQTATGPLNPSEAPASARELAASIVAFAYGRSRFGRMLRATSEARTPMCSGLRTRTALRDG